MEQPTTSQRLGTIPSLYDMQTTFYISALEGISDTDAHSRFDTRANHIAWLAGNLVQQRYELSELLDRSGKPYHQKANELFKNNQGIKENFAYPPLEQFREDWKEISPVLRKLLMIASDEQLDNQLKMGSHTFPVFEMITFTSYREANMIGQIALWRRLLGYDPMKYM